MTTVVKARKPRKRKLITGKSASEEKEICKIEINTRCVAKWRMVDLETGEVWTSRVDVPGQSPRWRLAGKLEEWNKAW